VSTARIALLLLAAACAAGRVRAQDDVTVVSPRADSIALTIYRDDLALITETRTVSLPASPVTLVLDGVVETLLPQSAVIADAARPLAESNFDFNRLTPKSLLEHSIGETVTITRTNPATGSVTRMPATILAVGEGVVLQLAGGHEALYCSGLPERLELTRVPDELLAKPKLSVKLAAGDAGERTVTVSYLAHGFAWSSDYAAHLNERSDRMQLSGWATLTNSTSTAFEQAQVQVVAGKLNILAAEEGGSAAEPVYANGNESNVDARDRIVRDAAQTEVALLRRCFATPLPQPPTPRIEYMLRKGGGDELLRSVAFEEVAVAGSRIVREELGDYQLYRLPWLTDLGARQTKQVLFLDKPAVRVERFYGFRLASFTEPPAEDVSIPNLIVRFENTERAGLGEPLPSGTVRVFEPYGGRDLFAGEAEIGDKAVGLPLELTIGRALNVSLEVTTEWDDAGERTIVMTEHKIVNNKSVPIELEVRHAVESHFTNVKVDNSSKPMRKKYGDLAWRFTVPPGTEQVLAYRLSALEGDR
jgi:hypothetical protein